MQNYYLSKSDFKVANECLTKLYYRKKGYPHLKENNPYLNFLAQGGYAVGKLATLLYPQGLEIKTGNDHQKALELTQEAMKASEVTLFEPAFLSRGKLIRVDILQKKHTKIELIEVKSKAWDSGQDEKSYKSKLTPYLEDVTFQYLTLSELYPEWEIVPFLFMPDKAKKTNVEGLNQLFRVVPIHTEGKFKEYDVLVDEERIADIYNDILMTKVEVLADVLRLLPVVREKAEKFLASLSGELRKVQMPLRKECFDCEFCVRNETFEKSGFDLCWEGIPQPEDHIKDLFKVGMVKNENKGFVIDDLIAAKNLSLFAFPEIYLPKKDGKIGKEGFRRKIQITYTRKKTEWWSEQLADELEKWEYPLHFIDFENTVAALPFHKNMSPYEHVIFQWSCHSLQSPEAELKHSAFLNTEAQFPNFKFAEALMETVGTEGTFLMWHTHENTMLKNIFEQMEKYNYENTALKNWLLEVVNFGKNDTGKFVDMNAIAQKHYFHPLMKGKTSIKVVLPAVLQSYSSPKIKHWLENFEEDISLFAINETGEVTDPYKLLPTTDLWESEKSLQIHVSEGTEAMRIYDAMLFGEHRNSSIIQAHYQQALLRYCKLDTLAMVIIGEHWKSLVSRTLPEGA